MQGDGAVGQGRGIDDKADDGGVAAGRLDGRYQFVLGVTLLMLQGNAEGASGVGKVVDNVVKAGGAIERGFTATQHIEVGAIEHQDGWIFFIGHEYKLVRRK